MSEQEKARRRRVQAAVPAGAVQGLPHRLAGDAAMKCLSVKLLAELEALSPAEVSQLAQSHARAVTQPLRRWTCPVCWVSVDSRTPPPRWLIVEPFTRVAACVVCRLHFERTP